MRYSYQFNQNGYSMIATATYPDDLTGNIIFRQLRKLKKSTTGRRWIRSLLRWLWQGNKSSGINWRSFDRYQNYSNTAAIRQIRYLRRFQNRWINPRQPAMTILFVTGLLRTGLGRVIRLTRKAKLRQCLNPCNKPGLDKVGTGCLRWDGQDYKAGSVSNEAFVIDNGFDAEIAEESDLDISCNSIFYDNYGRAII